MLGAIFNPATVERGRYLRASLALGWLAKSQIQTDDLGIADSLSSTSFDPTYHSSHIHNHGSHQIGFYPPDIEDVQNAKQRYWIIDLTGQVDQFPGLFRLKVYSNLNDPFDLNEDLSTILTSHHNDDSSVEIESEDEFDRSNKANFDGDEHLKKEFKEELLMDYDIGVYEERKFQVIFNFLFK